MAGTRPARGGTRGALGSGSNPTQGAKSHPKGTYSKPQPGTEMRNTAMPGQGRNPGGKTYDRLNPDPGRKAGGSAEPNAGDAWRRKGGGYGQLDDGSGHGFGVKSFTAGRGSNSKTMKATVQTPTSILNTGPSKFGAMNMDRPAGKVRDADSQLDSGDGTGWGGKNL